MPTRRTLLRGGALAAAALATGCDRQSPGTDPLTGYLDALEFSGVVATPDRTRAYGKADRTAGVANTASTTFDIASMGKMFTAVAVAQLVGRGEVAFTDPAGRFLPELPPALAPLTVHQLLTHTSGLGDAALARRPDRPEPPAAQLAAIVAEPPRFPPGEHRYSNDGFIVLGAVVEKIAGRPYADHVREYVLVPAGMTRTVLDVYRPRDVPGMAHGYAAGGRDVSGEPRAANPSGGARSTAGDMIAFATALTRHTLLTPELTGTVTTGKVATNRPGGPADDRYGYGFATFTVNGVRVVGHNGGTPGYESQLDIYPDRGVAAVALANEDGVLRPAIEGLERVLTR